MILHTMKRQRPLPSFCFFVIMFPLLLLHFVCGAWTAPSLYSTSLLLMPKQSRRNHQSITTSGISTKWCFVLQQSISRSSLSILNDDNSQESQPPPQYHVTMEYCTGCRWMMRCAWMAQELLTYVTQTNRWTWL